MSELLWGLLWFFLGAILSARISRVFDSTLNAIREKWSTSSRRRSATRLRQDYLAATANRADLPIATLSMIRDLMLSLYGGIGFIFLAIVFTHSGSSLATFTIMFFCLLFMWGTDIRISKLNRVVSFESYEKRTLAHIAKLENTTVELVKQSLDSEASS